MKMCKYESMKEYENNSNHSNNIPEYTITVKLTICTWYGTVVR